MGETPRNHIPYPEGTDRVMDGDNAMRAIAEAVDGMIRAGIVTITPTAANVSTTVAVVYNRPFPPGTTVRVAVGLATTTPQAAFIGVGGSSPTGFNATLNRTTVTTTTASWIAVAE